MKHLRTFWSTVLLLGCITTMAQPVSSSQLQEGKVPEGTVYYLPKTVIHFHLLIEKKTYTPGIFCQYAEKYLRQKPTRQEEEINHRIVDLRLSQTGVRDTSKCFIATLKGKSATAEMSLSEDGVLLAVNDTPIVVKKQLPFMAVAKKKKDSDPMRYLSDEVRMAGSHAKKAELVALQMAELQEHRQQLITGEAEEMPTDKAQLQLMLDEIDQQYESLGIADAVDIVVGDGFHVERAVRGPPFGLGYASPFHSFDVSLRALHPRPGCVLLPVFDYLVYRRYALAQ